MRSVIALNLRHCHPTAVPTSRAYTPKHAHIHSFPSPPSNRHLRISQPASPLAAAASSPSPMADSAPSAEAPKPFSVLFVCLGNICRSPAAEAVFTNIVRKRGIESKFNIDSAGTIGYHEGNRADSRMRAVAKKRGIEVTSISRQVRPSDFSDFDVILAMDMQNREDLLRAFERWRHKETLPEDAYKKMLNDIFPRLNSCVLTVKGIQHLKFQILTMEVHRDLKRCWICWKMVVRFYWITFLMRTARTT